MSGLLGRRVPVSGELYTVNPVAVRQSLNVYTENKRFVEKAFRSNILVDTTLYKYMNSEI